MSKTEYILEAREISKSFPGVKALQKVTLKIRPGTVHALMGENGAGKSTLMKCIYGIYAVDEGRILIGGTEAHIMNPRDAMDRGISMIHQELHTVPPQTVMENIWIGRIPFRSILGIHWADQKKLYRDTDAILKKLGIDLNPRTKVETLSAACCQLIEIARAVSFGARVIIMDEPTSSLTEKEAGLLFAIIKQLKKEQVAIIYISHKIDEILKISDEVTILRDGMLVGTWEAGELTTDRIVSGMVGRALTSRFPKKTHRPGPVRLEVEHLTSENPTSFENISFTVNKGEIFGIGGLVGAQRTELMETIFGLRPASSGIIKIDGRETKIRCPRDAIRQGMALLTEDRRADGIFGILSITDNTVAAEQNLHPQRYLGKTKLLIKKERRNADTQQYIDTLKIKTPSQKTCIETLSGGNQQKVLLGRWLLTGPDILILDEPTRGIDVGAKYEIYELMEQMALAGKCVIMISSEMPELMGMSDRIMVMCEGRFSGILEGSEISDEKIMLLASSVMPVNEGGYDTCKSREPGSQGNKVNKGEQGETENE